MVRSRVFKRQLARYRDLEISTNEHAPAGHVPRIGFAFWSVLSLQFGPAFLSRC
jgi:hypothetical protein